ncbi:MAG: transcriptional regulator [Deltaproteobacteria bacterium HGW-Deltaproteobacteria-8]|jgi:transcriptional regulator with XRE-family HTH domain|nr:MAG: transcriptional regulator [Deltaproteobacteria bacterium HGW-Deltaproteobacteria-8]
MTPLECRAERQKVRFRIRENLDQRGLSMLEIARRVNLNKNVVVETIGGGRNNRRVLAELRAVGVPEKYLFDPDVLKNKAA